MIAPGRRCLGATASLLLLLAVAGCSGSDDDGSGGATTTADVTTTTALVGTVTPTGSVLAGQCLNDVPDPEQQPFAVLVVPCEDSHTYEVYAQTDIQMDVPTGAGADYPGANEVANAAEAQCVSGFAAFMGIQWEASEYDIQAWWPSEASWTSERDRSILCAVYPVRGGTTKGSARGIAE